jgi:hypothetical protein
VDTNNCHLSLAVDLDYRCSTLACLGRDPVDHVPLLGVDVEDIAGSSEAVLLGSLRLVVLFVVL